MKRQGDIFFIRIESDEHGDVEPVPADPRGLVLAEGETSGHHHTLYGNGAKLFRFKDGSGRLLARLTDDGEVRVEGPSSPAARPRHHAVTLSKGVWEIRPQRTWTAQQARKVAD